ncbi:M10 family metallopeptidase [Novosphingobium sp.]|uniref:M10 family metallopeptidase n=1 Tax=Novosphingobium sp. TaxID=1874826 RepID=UPI002FDE363D
MALYNQASPTRTYALTKDARINGLLFADAAYRNAWSTVSAGKTQVSYSFIWGGGVASVFAPGYGTEPTAATVGAVPSGAAADVANAFQQWANVANIAFRQVAETASGTVGDIRIGLSSRVGTDNWGYTRVSAKGADNAHGDIWINPLFGTTSYAVNTYNFTAMMHEIGHALGLDHPSSGNVIPAGYDVRNYTIMSYNDPYGVYAYNPAKQDFDYIIQTPMVYDIAAIQAIYGANMAYHAGDNTYAYDPAHPFYATIWDAGGNDTIDLRSFKQGCWVDLHPGAYSSLGFTNVAVSDNLGIAYGVTIERLLGGSGADTLVGNDALNRIYGNGGNDKIYGYGGNDRLSGGAGDDILSGGEGNDMFLAGDDTGNDRYVGGPGNDLVTYGGAKAGVTVNLATGVGNGVAAGLGTDTISGVERATGGAFADTLLGDGYDDVLSGNGGNDMLSGMAGNDTLRGGAGKDTLTGGSGADRFVFERVLEFAGAVSTTCDVITDFSHAEGDTIILSPIDANTLTAADDPFVFIGSAPFHHAAGELRATIAGGNTLVQGDINGDGTADFALLLTGALTLTRYDFQL